MYRKWAAIVVYALAAGGLAYGYTNTVTLWAHGNEYEFYPDTGWLLIKSPGTYGLSATSDVPGQGGLGNIASITIDHSVTGNVDLYIVTQDGTGAGAYDVGMVNLSGRCTAVIRSLWITDNLGAGGESHLRTIGGAITVEGSFLNNTYIDTVAVGASVTVAGNVGDEGLTDIGSVDAGGVLTIEGQLGYGGAVTIGSLSGALTADALDGNLTVTGPGPHAGTLTINSFMGPDIIHFADSLSGTLKIGRDDI